MFTVIVMTVVIVWALKNIGRELGISDAIRRRVTRNVNREEQEDD